MTLYSLAGEPCVRPGTHAVRAMINGQARAMNKDTLQTQQHKTANNTNLRYWWCHVLNAKSQFRAILTHC